MKLNEFHQKLNNLLEEAMTPKDGLPLFAVVGITQCTLQDLQMRAFLDQQRAAAASFAESMAQGAKRANSGNQ